MDQLIQQYTVKLQGIIMDCQKQGEPPFDSLRGFLTEFFLEAMNEVDRTAGVKLTVTKRGE